MIGDPQVHDEINAMRWEITRLRTALEDIASGDIVVCKPLQVYARAVLKDGPPQKTA